MNGAISTHCVGTDIGTLSGMLMWMAKLLILTHPSHWVLYSVHSIIESAFLHLNIKQKHLEENQLINCVTLYSAS